LPLLVLILLQGACGPGTNELDAGTDTGGDTGGLSDAGPDSGQDAGADAGSDAGPDAGQNDGGLPHRALVRIEPQQGSPLGGTAVELRGEGFDAGLQIKIGSLPCEALTVVSQAVASCITPKSAGGLSGAVDVQAIWTDAYSDTLVGGFVYETSVDPIDYLEFQSPKSSLSRQSGESVNIEILVFKSGSTGGAGPGQGLSLEAAIGPDTEDPSLNPAAFSFQSMSYLRDQDGLTPGDLANDIYGLSLSAPTTPGKYRLAARASLGGGAGASWIYADTTGSVDGFDPVALPFVTVTAPAQITLDGVLDDAAWSSGVSSTSGIVTDWAGSSLSGLKMVVLDGTLYLGVEGRVTGGNALVVYLDALLGQGGGLADPALLSDGTGTLDDAISAGFLTPATFSTDFAFGTASMPRTASAVDGIQGFRDLKADPSNFAWIDGGLAPSVCSANACEASIPIATLGAQAGTAISAFVRIVNWDGQFTANQSLPEDPNAISNPLQVSVTLEITP